MTKKQKIEWIKTCLKSSEKVTIDFYPCTLYLGEDDNKVYCDYNGKTYDVEKDFDAVIVNNLYSFFGALTK